MLEVEMMTKGFAYLTQLSQYRIVKQEVPFLSRCIDIVMIDQNNTIISIEFKVSKWRHAIEQAVNHKLGADMSYICLPKRRVTDVLVKALNESGIGLMLFDENSESVITEVIPASINSTNIPAFRKMLIDNIGKVS